MTSVFLSSFLICGIITVCANDNTNTSVTPPMKETANQTETDTTSTDANEFDLSKSYEDLFPIDYQKEVDAYVEAKHRENPNESIEVPQEMLKRINAERREKYGDELDRYHKAYNEYLKAAIENGEAEIVRSSDSGASFIYLLP